MVFALQYPDFNDIGMEVSCLFVTTLVGYRLTQRFLLDRTSESPVALLTMVDAIVSVCISATFSYVEIDDMHHSMQLWMNDPSIVIMLLLSFCTFSLGHWTTLHLVKNDTATSTMVIANVSSGFCVIQGRPANLSNLSLCFSFGDEERWGSVLKVEGFGSWRAHLRYLFLQWQRLPETASFRRQNWISVGLLSLLQPPSLRAIWRRGPNLQLLG